TPGRSRRDVVEGATRGPVPCLLGGLGRGRRAAVLLAGAAAARAAPAARPTTALAALGRGAHLGRLGPLAVAAARAGALALGAAPAALAAGPAAAALLAAPATVRATAVRPTAPARAAGRRVPLAGLAEVLDLLRVEPRKGAALLREAALGALGDVEVRVQVRRARVRLDGLGDAEVE